jgi:Protein kinase domain
MTPNQTSTTRTHRLLRWQINSSRLLGPPSSVRRMPLAPGEVFAGYRIVRLLGSGGMGEVYLAQHPRLPRRDALKILPADVLSDPEYRQRFIREADLAAGLWHPNIVRVNDRGEFHGQLWIAMDYVDGTDASSVLRDRYPAGMPADEVAAIITAIASALDYAHQHGLLHRDVKPANILLGNPDDDERRILLGDFGIARNVGDISGLTATNMAVGTLPYAAPEQLMDDPMDGRADQYALAATAYRLLTGSPLFPYSNPAAVISRHLSTPPPALAASHPELAGLDPTLARALAKDPADRLARCIDFARAFAHATPTGGRATAAAQTKQAPKASRLTAKTAVAPKPPVEADEPRPRWPIAVAVITVILVLLGIAFLVRPWQHDQATTEAGTANTPTSTTPSITFDGMRDFVTAYYRDLPDHPNDAWTKLDAHCQNQTGLQQFLDFWATIQSVTLVSVSPRDATSVTARLTYARRDGQSDTEDRWFKMALVNGALLLDESQRVGSAPATESTTISPTSSGPPVTPPLPAPVATSTAPSPDPILTPADLGHAGAVCFSLEANPTDDEVAVVANRLIYIDGYTPERAADIANYATSVICPDMQGVVLRAANDRKTRGPGG